MGEKQSVSSGAVASTVPFPSRSRANEPMPLAGFRTAVVRLREHVRVPGCTGDRDGHRHDVAYRVSEPQIREASAIGVGMVARYGLGAEGTTERHERPGGPDEHHDDQSDRSRSPDGWPAGASERRGVQRDRQRRRVAAPPPASGSSVGHRCSAWLFSSSGSSTSESASARCARALNSWLFTVPSLVRICFAISSRAEIEDVTQHGHLALASGKLRQRAGDIDHDPARLDRMALRPAWAGRAVPRGGVAGGSATGSSPPLRPTGRVPRSARRVRSVPTRARSPPGPRPRPRRHHPSRARPRRPAAGIASRRNSRSSTSSTVSPSTEPKTPEPWPRLPRGPSKPSGIVGGHAGGHLSAVRDAPADRSRRRRLHVRPMRCAMGVRHLRELRPAVPHAARRQRRGPARTAGISTAAPDRLGASRSRRSARRRRRWRRSSRGPEAAAPPGSLALVAIVAIVLRVAFLLTRGDGTAGAPEPELQRRRRRGAVPAPARSPDPARRRVHPRGRRSSPADADADRRRGRSRSWRPNVRALRRR